MVLLGIREIDSYTCGSRIVELEGDWASHVEELALIIRRLSRRGPVHIVFYDNGKYIDMYSLYNELEPYIEALDDVTVFWEKSFEALIYHIILLGRTNRGCLVIILPYNRRFLSQLENTYMYRFRDILRKTADYGWEIVIINPIKNNCSKRGVYVADITLHIDFKDHEAIVKLVDTRVSTKRPALTVLNK